MIMDSQNNVLLEGTAATQPVFSHENHGTCFDRFLLKVPRLSGQADLLPILAPEPLLLPDLAPGTSLRIYGQLRSFNNPAPGGRRLILSVFPLQIEPGSGEACNQIFLTGSLCKPPVFRRTPLGRSICDLMLAVTRRYGRADYLPVIAWGQLALQASRLGVGDAVSLEGRIQSRVYQKMLPGGSEERIAYEVSVMHFEPPSLSAADPDR